MKLLAVLLVAIFVLNSSGAEYQTVATGTKDAPTKKQAEVKEAIEKRGVGKHSRTKVKLQDGREVKGYISQIGNSSFQITEQKSGRTTSISYADVSTVRGPGLSTGAKIAIAAGAGVAIVIVAI